MREGTVRIAVVGVSRGLDCPPICGERRLTAEDKRFCVGLRDAAAGVAKRRADVSRVRVEEGTDSRVFGEERPDTAMLGFSRKLGDVRTAVVPGTETSGVSRTAGAAVRSDDGERGLSAVGEMVSMARVRVGAVGVCMRVFPYVCTVRVLGLTVTGVCTRAGSWNRLTVLGDVTGLWKSVVGRALCVGRAAVFCCTRRDGAVLSYDGTVAGV